MPALRVRLTALAFPSALVLVTLAAGRAPLAQEGPEGRLPPPAPARPAPRPEGSEAEVLHEVCRYLRLSRNQIALLLPTARAADRVLEQLEPLRRELERVKDQPVELARSRAQLEQAEARLAADLTGLAAPQMARVFTREQIALAWRLMGGRLPLSAARYTLLQDPRWGFAGGTTLLGIEASIDLQLSRELIRSERSLGLNLVTGDVPGLRIFGPSDGGVGGALGRPNLRRGGGAEKPFPQLVIETDQLQDVLPPIERLAQRVYASREWLPVLLRAHKEGLGVAPSLNHRLVSRGSTRQVRQYRMDRGLRDQTGHGPQLEPLGGVLDHGSYVFGPGQGLKLPDIGVRDDYDIELSFRYLGEGGGYQKILDFKKGQKDGGLYVYQGHLTFYTLANGGLPVLGRDHRLRIERNRRTKVVKVSLDLAPIFSFIDLDDEAVFEEGTGLFFVDDVTTRNEQGPGGVRWVSVRGPASAPN